MLDLAKETSSTQTFFKRKSIASSLKVATICQRQFGNPAGRRYLAANGTQTVKASLRLASRRAKLVPRRGARKLGAVLLELAKHEGRILLCTEASSTQTFSEIKALLPLRELC